MPALGSADTPTTECDVLVDNCRLGRRLLLSAIVATFSRMCQRARSTTASPLVPTDSRLNHRAVILSHPSLIVLHPSPLSPLKKRCLKAQKIGARWRIGLRRWVRALEPSTQGKKAPVVPSSTPPSFPPHHFYCWREPVTSWFMADPSATISPLRWGGSPPHGGSPHAEVSWGTT